MLRTLAQEQSIQFQRGQIQPISFDSWGRGSSDPGIGDILTTNLALWTMLLLKDFKNEKNTVNLLLLTKIFYYMKLKDSNKRLM